MPKFNVTRSITIDSDPQTVFDALRDFSTWNRWSPWLLAEPNADFQLHGDPNEIGGGYSWDGNVVGAGRMEHRDLIPPGRDGTAGQMSCDLEFFKPWKSQADVTFRVQPDPSDDQITHVVWGMASSLPFFLFWMKPMMVAVIGMDYDRGLRMFKEMIETGRITSQTNIEGIGETPARRLVGLSGSATLSEIGRSMEQQIARIRDRLSLSDIDVDADGVWMAVYHKMSLKTQTVHYSVGAQCAADQSAPSDLESVVIPQGRAMCITHTGRYDHLGNAWFAGHSHLRAQKSKLAKTPAYEIYCNDPRNTPQDELLTKIYLPVK